MITAKQGNALLPTSIKLAADDQNTQAVAKLKEFLTGKQIEQDIAQNAMMQGNKDREYELNKANIEADNARQNAANRIDEQYKRALIGKMGQQAKAITKANIAGFDITDPENVVPTAEGAKKVSDANAKLLEAKATLPGIKQDIMESSWKDRFGVTDLPFIGRVGTDKAHSMDQHLNMVLGQAQAILNSGVLNKNEIPILRGMIGDLTGIGSMIRPPEKTAAMVNGLSNFLTKHVESLAAAKGYTPKPGSMELLSELPEDEAAKKPAAPKKNRVQDLLK